MYLTVSSIKGTNLDSKLMKELANSGVKYNPDDVVMITKTPDGKLLWLEKGNADAGLKHIVDGHATDFLNKGISVDQIHDLIKTTVSKGKIVGYQGRGTGRSIYEVIYNGKTYHVAVTVGSNGFIVGANPVTLK